MRVMRYLIPVMMLVAASACGPSPTAPVPVIAVSQATVSLERTAAVQVTAAATLSNVTSDISSSAVWRSSNEQVARVASGLITAVGPGTAIVTVEHQGATKDVTVTVRRRVYLDGSITVTDGRGGVGAIAGLHVFLDDLRYGERGLSNPNPTLTVDFGTVSYRRSISPGSHRLDLQIPTRPGDAFSEYPFTVVFVVQPRVVDLDTGEIVGTLSLENRAGMFPDDPTLSWTFTLNAFTS